MEISLTAIALLTLVAFIAGVVDAIAGGGGLLTVPALLTAGLPPHFVFGTNKGSAVFGSFAALLRFRRAGLIHWERARVAFPLGFFGSLLGAAALLALDPKLLRPLVLVLLVCAGIIVVFVRPRAVTTKSAVSNSLLKLAVIALLLGAYDGFFGPGTGTFLIIAFVTVLQQTLSEATANAKVVNFASNLAAVILFIWRGTVLWKISLPMAAGQFLGGTLGAHFAVKGGDTIIRRVVLCVVVALVTKLAYDLIAGR